MTEPRYRMRSRGRSATAPDTFQGRPVVQIEWNGRMVEAVAGVSAAKLAVPIRMGEERGLSAAVRPGQRAPLDIAVVDAAVLASVERGSGARDTRVAFEWTEPLLLDRGSVLPNDPYLSQQWALAAIDAGAAWSRNDAGAPVLVAVLDSGLPIEAGQLSHTELNDAARVVRGRDLVNNDDDPADDHGHGTHVLGIIAAARDNGVGIVGLWTGPVAVVKVFDSQLTGSSITYKDGVAAAVDLARAAGARLVINYSGGGPDGRVKQEATEYAGNEGALVVAAAGNGFGTPLDFPAAYAGGSSNVIAVGAVDAGDASPAFASRGPEMTVVAPGADVLSTLPNYAVTLNHTQSKQTKYDRLEGTSQATPHVAALAALIWARRPSWTAAEVRAHIRATADVLAGDSDLLGGGRINVTRALNGL